ncbi:reverse transcriptase domain-containing protein [Tanacetum coccineum]
MPPRMRTRSVGRPAAESLGGGMGVRIGRGGGRGRSTRLPDDHFPAIAEPLTRYASLGCSYNEFLACNPKEYDGKGGVVVLTRWIEKMENVQDMSGCSNDQKVKYTASSFMGKALTWWNSQIRTLSQEVVVSMSWNDLKNMMIEEFCPSHEMQKLETELWNHVMVEAGHDAYTDRFHELARLVPHLVTPESRKIQRKDNKRTRTGNAFATTTNPVGRENVGAWPKGVPRNVNPANARNPTVRACYECGSIDHVKSAYPRLNRAQGPEGNRQNQVVANNEGIEPSELGFRYETEIASGQLVEINKVIKGCRLEIKGHVFDIDLIPFGHEIFDVIIVKRTKSMPHKRTEANGSGMDLCKMRENSSSKSPNIIQDSKEEQGKYWMAFGLWPHGKHIETKTQVCLLCEVILKQISAFNFFCASFESITAIEKLGKWVKGEKRPRDWFLGFVGREKWIWCMRTRSQSRNLNHQQQQAPPAFVEPFDLEEPIENPAPPVVTMDDNRTMAQLLEAPTEGYEDAIVVPEITADNFELKHGLLTLGAAQIWLEKEPPRSILTWDDLVSKFIKKNFPLFKTTNLRNEITTFQQRFDETFYEARDRFNDLLWACPHHRFSELHQLDTFYNALNSNDQDSLNSAAGGNFLDKMPRDCLRIIESKSKVRNSRNKPVVAKVGTSTSTSGISPEVAVLTTDVAELKDMMKTLILDKQKSQAPATVKAVEEKCVTCGGAHSYRNCPATDGNVYRDNIQEYVSQAAVANFNQGNTGYRAPIANQIRPPGFPPVQNNQGNNQNRYNQGNNYNQNRGNNYNQNRGNNYNQGQIYQPPVNQPPAYQAPAPQTQGVTKTDFESYVKANDAVMQNIQTNITTLTNSNLELKNMFSQFMKMNTASSLGTSSLPSNTVTNPKEDLKVVERETEVTKDMAPPINNGSTKDVQPPVVKVQPHVPNSEPVVAPVSTPMPNPNPSIPYPSRRNDERYYEKANDQIEKFYEIFKDLSFEISLTDALILMPKFASTLKASIGNKEKLSEMDRTPLNEHCSAVILNKLPKKHGDPGKFLIPCDFPRMDECLALADLGASINLMPLSV